MDVRARRERSLSYLIVGPLAIVLAFPFYVMVITAFKSQSESYDVSKNPYWFHHGPTFANASFLFHNTLYGTWLRNTVLIGLAVVGITLLLSVPAGYALARRLPALGAGGAHGRDLLVLARLERVRLRLHVHLELDEPDAVDRCLHRPHPRG